MALHVGLIPPQIPPNPGHITPLSAAPASAPPTHPHVPPNTANLARLCAATDSPLHLIGPLGFSLDARDVRRAGLDYWDKTDLWVHADWFIFRDAISRDRCLYFSANAE